MAKTLAYMITWTTYGTWLQGDERGYMKNGRIYSPNKALLRSNKKSQLLDAVILTKVEQQLVREAIIVESKRLAQNIYALFVNATHIHIVVEYSQHPISKIVAYYKKAARLALKSNGHTGKIWTRGYDKRFCFDRETLEQKITYVQNHNE